MTTKNTIADMLEVIYDAGFYDAYDDYQENYDYLVGLGVDPEYLDKLRASGVFNGEQASYGNWVDIPDYHKEAQELINKLDIVK